MWVFMQKTRIFSLMHFILTIYIAIISFLQHHLNSHFRGCMLKHTKQVKRYDFCFPTMHFFLDKSCQENATHCHCGLFPIKPRWPKKKTVDHRFWFVVLTKEYVIKKLRICSVKDFRTMGFTLQHTVGNLLHSASHHADVLYFLKDLTVVRSSITRIETEGWVCMFFSSLINMIAF